MSKSIRIALAQINTTVGDFKSNKKKIIENIQKAKNLNADIIAFPELTVTGYPPEDLLLRPQFIKDNFKCLQQIIPETKNITVVTGFVDSSDGKLYNCAAILNDGKHAGSYHKIHLPNYGVFDEKRYFDPGTKPLIFTLNGIKIGISICEDLWIPDSVIDVQALIGDVEVIINISASPYCFGKIAERENLVIKKAITNRVVVNYINLIGGQDELVFDGSSLIVDEKGKVLGRCKQFEEDLLLFDIDVSEIKNIRKNDKNFIKRKSNFHIKCQLKSIEIPTSTSENKHKQPITNKKQNKLESDTEIYYALVLGTKDYIQKNGFKKVVLGGSGGIDSALTAAIAVDAIGAQNVIGVAMPSEFSSQSSLEDAKQLAANLGIEYKIIPIQKTFDCYKEMLNDTFLDLPFDVTEENIQSRIRGNIIMALSNKFGWLALTTGNKSEVSVGYCTLYGDMAGGFAVIKDVPKTLVYELSENLNDIRGQEIIPRNTIVKPPSAELRHDQKDEDSLPPYDVLDPLLADYIEKNLSIKQILAKGYDEEIVRKVIRLVDLNEYKRRQGPPGIKITPRAFGKDRRMPITSRYQR